MVLGLMDAAEQYKDRFEKDDASNLIQVIMPSIWIALFEHNSKFCSNYEAKLLSHASLALRPS